MDGGHCSICGYYVADSPHVETSSGRIYCFECLFRTKELLEA